MGLRKRAESGYAFLATSFGCPGTIVAKNAYDKGEKTERLQEN